MKQFGGKGLISMGKGLDKMNRGFTSMGKFLARAKRVTEKGEDPEEAKRKDQYFILGYGIVAYLDLIFTFFWMFVLFSLCMIPVLNFYQIHNAYPTVQGYENYSLGNVGQSSA